jgi:hypothetical protein
MEMDPTTMTGSQAAPGLHERPISTVALGVIAPLVVVAMAYVLWWLSDRLLYIGPFDRAAFGWIVVIPVWVSAPIVAGYAWRGLEPRVARAAAAVVGGVISAAAAILFWQAVASPACADGSTRTPGEWLLPSIALGLVIGGGVAATGLLATSDVRNGHPRRALITAIGAEVGMVFVALLVVGVALMGPGCQRPSL